MKLEYGIINTCNISHLYHQILILFHSFQMRAAYTAPGIYENECETPSFNHSSKNKLFAIGSGVTFLSLNG